jgi:hypothetical protein
MLGIVNLLDGQRQAMTSPEIFSNRRGEQTTLQGR